jgi:hypothetical protein
MAASVRVGILRLEEHALGCLSAARKAVLKNDSLAPEDLELVLQPTEFLVDSTGERPVHELPTLREIERNVPEPAAVFTRMPVHAASPTRLSTRSPSSSIFGCESGSTVSLQVSDDAGCAERDYADDLPGAAPGSECRKTCKHCEANPD